MHRRVNLEVRAAGLIHSKCTKQAGAAAAQCAAACAAATRIRRRRLSESPACSTLVECTHACCMQQAACRFLDEWQHAMAEDLKCCAHVVWRMLNGAFRMQCGTWHAGCCMHLRVPVGPRRRPLGGLLALRCDRRQLVGRCWAGWARPAQESCRSFTATDCGFTAVSNRRSAFRRSCHLRSPSLHVGSWRVCTLSSVQTLLLARWCCVQHADAACCAACRCMVYVACCRAAHAVAAPMAVDAMWPVSRACTRMGHISRRYVGVSLGAAIRCSCMLVRSYVARCTVGSRR